MTSLFFWGQQCRPQVAISGRKDILVFFAEGQTACIHINGNHITRGKSPGKNLLGQWIFKLLA